MSDDEAVGCREDDGTVAHLAVNVPGIGPVARWELITNLQSLLKATQTLPLVFIGNALVNRDMLLTAPFNLVMALLEGGVLFAAEKSKIARVVG